MASKQLGKLRQWAGEVISSRDKSTVTDEFRELETDVELRKAGLLRLQTASDAYHHSLSKKKDFSSLNEGPEKLLPGDVLGIVMRKHGEEFGEDSAFGSSLVKLGEAHCKVATLQEAYALTFQDTFMMSIKNFVEDIKDYEHQRKKLESRRLSYDAAISKLDKIKGSKKEKEKDRKEAEDELQTARLRYEETSEDVRARASAIQDNEIQQLRDLTSFLDVEMNFIQQYLEVLQDTKANWCDPSALPQVDIPRGNGPTHVFSRDVNDPSMSDSGRSKKRSSRSNIVESSESSGDESAGTASRRSIHRRPSGSGSRPSSRPPSRPPSRPTSRAGRKRSDSSATAGGTERDKVDKAGKKQGVAGWVSSVTGRGKKDRDKFAALTDGEDGDDGKGELNSSTTSFSSKSHSRTKSKDSVANASSKVPARIIKSPVRKAVRALYDFSGASDELTFKVGDEIIVVNEVLDGWWMGELDGQTGLFPTPYTEVISAISSRRASSNRSRAVGSSLSANEDSVDAYGYVTNDLDDDQPFDDHFLAASRSPLYGAFDSESVTDSATEEEEEKRLMPARKPSEDDDNFNHRTPSRKPSPPPILPRRSLPDTSIKKAPPPPPPRRSTGNVAGLAPPIPHRRSTASQSQSSGSLDTSSSSSLGHDVSPFDSASEVLPCKNFRQNPFKPVGMCNNCMQMHS